MGLPNMPVRMNKCYFKFRIYDRGAYTPKDDDYREPEFNRVYSRDICVVGQLVGYRQFFKLQRTQTGDSSPSNGSAVFRPNVLRKLGLDLKKGDKVIQVNETTCDFNIIHVSPLGPYRGRHLLILIEFEQNRKELESI